MGSENLLKFCLEKGLLVDKEMLGLFSEIEDIESIKFILEKIKHSTSNSIITKQVFLQNREQVNSFFSILPQENQRKLEKLKIKLGLSIEITKETQLIPIKKEREFNDVRIISKSLASDKKVVVKDFVTYFRNRFVSMRNILLEHSDLKNLVSLNKLAKNNQGISVIGIVSSRSVTKNGNIILEIEDLTGKTKILINKNKEDLYEKAEDIVLDSVLGFKCSGNDQILFCNEVIFPDSVLFERKKSPVEEYALFLGDLHYGSKNFMKENFLSFIDYLNGKVPNTPEVEKIKYVFFIGDLITGVGNYPNQEKDLLVVDLEQQFSELADILSTVRKDIKIILSPGNHDCVRLMEPQPLLNEKYAWPLYNIENIIFTENPSTVNIGAKSGFGGYNVLGYHGFSFPYYANTVSKLMLKKSMNTPERIMEFLLKQRHLAPSHTSVQYFPGKEDCHIIKEVPDIFVAGHTHKSAVVYYNNILLISSSSWETKTPYQEKFGNEPDHCKIPMFNLKTRAIKILDFE
ncbi:hypothetical protein HOD88_02570 [archaeon]|jgi:DNA polymerase II small subunit|nr:hypothetical protein [archaeon]